jgi:chromate transporter
VNTPVAPPVGYREALRLWLRVAAQSFGGPAGQIAVMHRLVVEERRWLREEQFLHALSYCMLLPGPEAQQLATYSGWLLHGYRGGLTAGVLFVLPGFVALLLLSVIYAEFGSVEAVAGLFFGLQAAVLAVVAQALGRLWRRLAHTRFMLAVAGAAFAGLYFLDMPFPVVIATAAGAGLVAGRLRPGWFAAPAPRGVAAGSGGAQLARAARVAGCWLALWLGPVALLVLLLGRDHVFAQLALFFSQTAVVSFGGAYAVLGYVAEHAVEERGWLAPQEMIHGLALAETTPGPLIMVLEFVGFQAAYRDPGALPPLLAGTLGATITVWVTFTPCFLWIFLGAPYVERLRAVRALNAALAAIAAAVAGVVLNLVAWFALHVLFDELREVGPGPLSALVPVWSTLDAAALALAAAACVALFRLRTRLPATLAGAGVAGIGYRLLLA